MSGIIGLSPDMRSGVVGQKVNNRPAFSAYYTANVAVGTGTKWTNALAKAAGVLGVVKVDWSTTSGDLVNNLVFTSSSVNASGKSANLPILLQAEDNSTSVYMAAVSRGGTPTTAADDYEIILHLERS